MLFLGTFGIPPVKFTQQGWARSQSTPPPPPLRLAENEELWPVLLWRDFALDADGIDLFMPETYWARHKTKLNNATLSGQRETCIPSVIVTKYYIVYRMKLNAMKKKVRPRPFAHMTSHKNLFGSLHKAVPFIFQITIHWRGSRSIEFQIVLHFIDPFGILSDNM